MQPLNTETGFDRTYMSRHDMSGDSSSVSDPSFKILPRFLRRAINSTQFSRFLFSPAVLKSAAIVGVLGSGAYFLQEDRAGGAAITAALANSGLTVEKLIVNGTRELDPQIVQMHLAPMLGSTILGFDAELARTRVTEISWVKNASVRKSYPDTLVVDLVERRPVALWKSDGVLFLISPDGFVIAEAGVEHMHLPQVVGEGANEVASEFLSGIDRFGSLVSRADAYIRVASRRWDLLLDNGLRVLLPESGWRDSLLELQQMQESNRILDREIVQIDMRLPDRVVLRLEKDTADNRREQFEEILKPDGRRT